MQLDQLLSQVWNLILFWESINQQLIKDRFTKAPPYLAFAEAGGMVKDAAGNDLDFSKGRYLDRERGIIATNKHLMPLVLKAVQEAMKEEQ